jgi:hypothetical protein
MYNDEYMMCHEQYMQSVEDTYKKLLKSTYEIPDNLVQSVLSALNALGYNSTSSISSAFGALGYTTSPSTLDTFSFAIDVRGIRTFNGEFAVKVIEAIQVIDINRNGIVSMKNS